MFISSADCTCLHTHRRRQTGRQADTQAGRQTGTHACTPARPPRTHARTHTCTHARTRIPLCTVIAHTHEHHRNDRTRPPQSAQCRRAAPDVLRLHMGSSRFLYTPILHSPLLHGLWARIFEGDSRGTMTLTFEALRCRGRPS